MNPINVLAFSGSFREKSFNTMLLNAFAKNAPGEVVVEIADFKDVPLYDQDAETNFPEAVTALKAKIEAADVILAITPEYNRGIPGVLKNMIDWTSRPWGQNSWKGKVVYVAGASMGAIGTAVAQTS
jgi:chromate reductase